MRNVGIWEQGEQKAKEPIAFAALFHNSCEYITNNKTNPEPRDHIFSGLVIKGQSGTWEVQGCNYHAGDADIEARIGQRKADKVILVPVALAAAQRMIDLRDALNRLHKNNLLPVYFSPSMRPFTSKEVKGKEAIDVLGRVNPAPSLQKPEEYQLSENAEDSGIFARARSNCTTMTAFLFEVAGIGANRILPNLTKFVRGFETHGKMKKEFEICMQAPWDRNLGLPSPRSDIPRGQLGLSAGGRILLSWPNAEHVTISRMTQFLNQRALGGLNVADILARAVKPLDEGQPQELPDYFTPALVTALERGVKFTPPEQRILGL
jgi:hypothetical protein